MPTFHFYLPNDVALKIFNKLVKEGKDGDIAHFARELLLLYADGKLVVPEVGNDGDSSPAQE